MPSTPKPCEEKRNLLYLAQKAAPQTKQQKKPIRGLCSKKRLIILCTISLRPANQSTLEAKAQQEPYRNSEWIGKEKERINITVSTFSCLTSWENDYGYTYIYRITDDKNNVYTWKTSNCLGENSIKSLTGTVKTHTEYRGIKQTELTRCRVEAKEPILEPVEEVEIPSSVSDFVEWYDELFGDEQKHQNCDLEK